MNAPPPEPTAYTGKEASGTLRHLPLRSATALVVASMVGAGVFVTSGYSLSSLGSRPLVLLAWAVGGAIALLGALCYGALARRLTASGGEYHFLSETLHPFFGFLAGWISLVAGFSAPIALAALAFEAYASLPGLDALPPRVLATMLVVAAGCAHGLHLHAGVRTQDALVGLKLGLLLLFCAVGAQRILGEPLPPAAPETSLPSFGTFATSLVWISLSYSGWNAAVYAGGEVRDPERNLPRSLVLGAALVTGLYLALNALFLWSGPVEALAGREDVAAEAARQLGGGWLEALVRGTVAVGLVTSVLAMMMTGPRVYARMAEDGCFPALFARRRGHVPTFSVLLQALLALLLVWIGTLRELLGYVGWVLSTSTALTIVGLLVLRHRRGREAVPVPGHPWVPLLFVGLTLGAAGLMLFEMGQEPWYGLGTLAAGAMLWPLVRRARRRR